MWSFDAYLFPPDSSDRQSIEVTVSPDGVMEVRGEDGTLIATEPWRGTSISDRVGSSTRRIILSDGSVIETTNNDMVDEIERNLRGTTAGALFHRMERLTYFTLVVLVVTAITTVAFFKWGLPAAADRVAHMLPSEALTLLGDQSLAIMDKGMLSESHLSDDQKALYRAHFQQLENEATGLNQDATLIFRSAPFLGPNAFALPNGTIVLTDEIVALSTHEKQIMGVLAHEISHVEERHGMRGLLRSSTIAVIIVLITGDMAELTEMAIAFPAFMVEMGYSRSFEREADTRAIALLTKLNVDPSHLADLFELLGEDCGKRCDSNWMSSHPDIPDRVMKIRNAGQ